MLLIECPWCGARAETEFSYGGEAGIVRPPDPDALSDAEWADYLFNRTNPRGAHRELWNHAQGCRRWFAVERDTVTNRIGRSFTLSSNGTGQATGAGDAAATAAAESRATESAGAGTGAAAEADIGTGASGDG